MDADELHFERCRRLLRRTQPNLSNMSSIAALEPISRVFKHCLTQSNHQTSSYFSLSIAGSSSFGLFSSSLSILPGVVFHGGLQPSMNLPRSCQLRSFPVVSTQRILLLSLISPRQNTVPHNLGLQHSIARHCPLFLHIPIHNLQYSDRQL